MRVKLVTKNCRQCGALIENVSSKIQICDNCRCENKQYNVDKNNKRKSEQDLKEAYERAKEYIEKYTKDNGKTLTPDGFNEVSPISSTSIIRSFKCKTWIDILEMFNKKEEFKKYVKEEYRSYINTTDNIFFKTFLKQHKYITYGILKSSFNMKELINYCGGTINRNNIKDYEENFLYIKNKLGYIPLYQEFADLTKIKISGYGTKFNFKKNIYHNIVNMYSTDNEYNDFVQRSKIHKTEVGKQTCNIGKTLLTLDDLEIEFRKVFDKCFEDTKVYPSRRLFNKLSKHDDKTYRKMYNINWTDICKHYGYPTQYKKSIFETYVLTYMSIILSEEYETQKTFDWLRGINDFPLFCDGYFSKYNLIIEVDGMQHRKPVAKFGGEKAFKILQANDAVKNELIPEHGIKLLRIANNTNWHNVEYLRSRLEEVLGIEFKSILVAK